MKKRFVVLTAALAVTLACASCSAGNAGWNPEAVSNTPLPHTDDAYARYLAQYSSAPQGLGEIFIDTQNQQQGEWRFSVPNAGLYHLEITYRAVEGRVNDIETFLLIDGEAPYKNAEMFVLPRLWADETQTVNGRFPLDAAGNETRPRQAELFEAQTSFVTDSLGKYSGPLSFYLSEGSHTVSLAPRLERAEFISLCFRRSESPVPYSEYYQPSRSDSSGQMLVLEAELAGLKSSNTLFPTYDKSRASISPSHPALTRYNTIGRDTWNKPGQTLTYYAEVPQDGYYHLAFKVKQNMKRGMYSTRAVYVDGEIPFAELGGVRFPNQPAWYVTGAADDAGAPYKIFLTKGRHAISIEAVLGAEEEPLREADSLVAEMNEWYRKIIVITGSNADSSRVTLDLNRDFLLDLKIPGLIDAFAAISARLDKCAADINALYGEGSGGNAGTVMAELAQQLRVFVDDPDKIPARLENYYGGISSMATWVLEMRSQPLEMDWFALYSPDVSAPEAGGNFFSQLLYRTQMFFSSFSGGYNALGVTADKAQKPLEVWVSLSDISSGSTASGRDQANVIKRLIDGMFTPATGIKVNLSLISGSNVLMQAIVAGRGPDAAMVVSRDVPVNLAMRGALVPLDNFEGFESAADNFMPGALTPYQYEGGTYALPETQSFDMLFYRT
ncbi:MAG: hypothetical protein LBR83_00935, partial [Clostridiales bacterium]|nr:hypothetical protein [Clostridiales bacterium]